MTITQNSAAPLVAVVGGTGTQGGSVVKALAESDKAYRVRGLTRDATKPAAQSLVAQGVELAIVEIGVQNKEAVSKAFSGANAVFLVTAFVHHGDPARETAEGKMMIDAAKAAGVERIVWSGLPAVKKLSGGVVQNLLNFDSKAAVTEYGFQSGVPFVNVQAGFFDTNFLGWAAPRKKDDGSFVIQLALRPTTSLPMIYTEEDYGLYVLRALEAPVFPNGSEILTGEYITVEDIVRQLAEATGKRITFEQISSEQLGKDLSVKRPPPVVATFVDAMRWFDEFGYYGGAPASSLEGLRRTPKSWIEFCKTADWSKFLS
ncbi:NAD(P)-binding protein [Favolaschia claudopus]|uniref:NAD(P)-binding protein n=1 Tax=Favolaschia claudopus TaxID=2862362 RepID=A0AAW0D7C2_9AGAR